MDLRLTFNEDAQNYDKFRPTYANELFDDVIRYSSLSSDKRALEIGIGTGQATLPFLKKGCHITAIELGDKLAQFSREKFAEYPNLDVVNQEFESVPLNDNSYDLVYSATAFHWIPQEIGLPKVHSILKSGGVFAWFSNHPSPAREYTHIHEEFEKIYSKYSQYFGQSKPILSYHERQLQAEENCRNRSNILTQYGFVDVSGKVYYGLRTFSAEEYTALLCTYSDHRAIPEDVRIPFLKEIEDVIDHNGGTFALSDIMILSMGRKA